jgi:hypothetical protein
LLISTSAIRLLRVGSHAYRTCTQLGDPVSHDPLDLVLPDRDHVRVTRREIARVQDAPAEHHHPI